MPVVNWGGATGTSTMDRDDENHLTSAITINNGATLTVEDNQTIRFDGNYNITSTAGGSGILTGTGTATTRITWQPNGAATTWYEDNTDRYIASDGTGGWTVSYHDFIGILPATYPTSGTNAWNNIRVRGGRKSNPTVATGFYFAPSGGTNTVTDISCYGCTGQVWGPVATPVSGGTNVVRRVFIDGGGTGMTLNVTGGTNTFSDFKITKCAIPLTFAGTAAVSITNLVFLHCTASLTTVPGATSTITRLISVGAPTTGTAHDVLRASIGGGIVLTFDEAYVDMAASYGFVNTAGAGTQARLVVNNSVLANHRISISAGRSGVNRGTSSGNDYAFPSDVDGANSAIDGSTSDNDHLASTGGMSGPAPLGAEVMYDWASANWSSVTDTDSGNTTSTSTPAQYGVGIVLAANRTNARATPNKPLTVSSIVATPGTNQVQITWTTGIKARSRILFGTSAGVTRANATSVSPWKYHGILDPEMVDFTLPVTSHDHTVSLPPGTYFAVPENYDACGRRFLGAETSITIAAAGGGGGTDLSSRRRTVREAC